MVLTAILVVLVGFVPFVCLLSAGRSSSPGFADLRCKEATLNNGDYRAPSHILFSQWNEAHHDQ